MNIRFSLLRLATATFSVAIPLLALAQSPVATFTNPVYPWDSADPTVQRAQDGTFYCYATAIQTRKSKDLVHWQDVPGVFTTPDWNGPGFNVWAADVNYVDGQYLMYYALAQWGNLTTTGIGVARGTNPDKFTDVGRMFRSNEIGVVNSIDACYIEEGDKKYLAWGSFRGIYISELTDDGLQLKNPSRKTMIAGTAYEGAMIYKRGGYYYLFASIGTCCDGARSTYTTVVGRSTSLMGPYKNRAGRSMLDNAHDVVIQPNDRWAGTGHNSEIITDDNGDDWIMYHAYDKKDPSKGRILMLDKVKWNAMGWPTVNNGTASTTPQPAPVFYTGSGAILNYKMRNMDLARSNFHGWEVESEGCEVLQNGVSEGSVHMPLMHAQGGKFEVSQTLGGLKDGIYELSLDNFSTAPGVNLVVNEVKTLAIDASVGERYVPSTKSSTAREFLRADTYRQQAYGLVQGGEVRIAIEGQLAADQHYYAGDLRLTYRGEDSLAAAPVLASYCQKSQQMAHDTTPCFAPYRRQLLGLVEQSEQAAEPYAALMSLLSLQDSISISQEQYAQLATEMERMEEIITGAKGLKIDVTASQELLAQAREEVRACRLDVPQMADFLARFQKAIYVLSHSFVGGDGTAAAPFLIATPTQLEQMHHVLKPDTLVHFRLVDNIDMTGRDWAPLNTSASKNRYCVALDGQGHLIIGLNMQDEGYPSFFGTMRGVCRNLGIVDATVHSSRSACAMLAGYARSYPTPDGESQPSRVENCYITGSIRCDGYAGPVAGVLASGEALEIENVYTNVDMRGDGGNANRMGGLVGRVWGALSISRSYAAGSVQASWAGGIAAGGQTSTTPASTFTQVIAWNTSVAGKLGAFSFAETTERDVLAQTYHSSAMLLDGNPAPDGRDATFLLNSAAQWQSAWHPDPTAGNGYPILAWQFARGDYRQRCGFATEDAIHVPLAMPRRGLRQYFNMQGQQIARPNGIAIERDPATGRTRKMNFK